jgi:hypothetical protein
MALLALQVFNEANSHFYEANAAPHEKALAELGEADAAESNMKYTVNGYVFCNTPGLNMTVGERWAQARLQRCCCAASAYNLSWRSSSCLLLCSHLSKRAPVHDTSCFHMQSLSLTTVFYISFPRILLLSLYRRMRWFVSSLGSLARQ